MANKLSSRIFLVSLIVCLCLSSLIILPMINVAGLFVPEISEADPETYNLFDQSDFDEEYFIVLVLCVTATGLIFSRSRPMDLDFQSAYLSPDSPPPKHS